MEEKKETRSVEERLTALEKSVKGLSTASIVNGFLSVYAAMYGRREVKKPEPWWKRVEWYKVAAWSLPIALGALIGVLCNQIS